MARDAMERRGFSDGRGWPGWKAGTLKCTHRLLRVWWNFNLIEGDGTLAPEYCFIGVVSSEFECRGGSIGRDGTLADAAFAVFGDASGSSFISLR